MPTIEIASINSTGLDLKQDDFEVAIIEENKLESHRGLFYDFLLKQNGTIIHIGNPDFKNDKEGGFFAGQIINWDFDSDTNFQFRQENKDDIKRLLKLAMSKSSDNKIYFLTDYQFGPELEEFKTVEGLTAFWEIHEKDGLRLNTLYEIK
jgi:hypothetical protein